MKGFLDKSKELMRATATRVSGQFEHSMTIVRDVINGLPLVVSFERTEDSGQQYDEKHYFVIPYYLSESQFSLHTMRALPANVPEINDLPKRRVFHFPNSHAEAALKDYLLSTAKDYSDEQNTGAVSSLESLANDIDKLDSKLTYGMLIVGGLAAIFNPLLGAGIAIKAVIPSVSGLLTKYGLRPVGEHLTRSQLEKKAKEAQEHVLKQFSEANTLKLINPILQELEFTLTTTESQHNPLIDPNLSQGSIPQLHDDCWRQLTEKAIYHVYKEVIEDPTLHKQAKLGPQDIRWLNYLFVGIDKT